MAMVAVSFHLVAALVVALLDQSAAHTRAGRTRPEVAELVQRVVDATESSPVGEAADTTSSGFSDAASDSQSGRTFGKLKQAWNRPPTTLTGWGQLIADLMGIPTQAPITSPLQVPGYFANMFWASLSTNWIAALISFTFSLLLVLAFGYAYSRYKTDAKVEHHLDADRQAWKVLREKGQGDWRFNLCGCFSAPWTVICLACCCPSIRWADTMRMAGLCQFWAGFLAFTLLFLINPYTAGLTGLMLLCLVTWKRQQLRDRFHMEVSVKTKCMDCCTYLCCMCCAIVQEAHQMEEAVAVKHQALQKFNMYELRGATASQWNP